MRFPHFAFGSTVGFTAGWFAWIGTVTLAPIEVEASLQYLTGISWLSWLTHKSGGVAVLSGGGYATAVVLSALFTVLNAIGVRWFSTTNIWAVWWKIAVPVIAVIVLFAYGLTWLAVVLYIDSFVSPAGTGLVYTATSSRVFYGLSRHRYVPRPFERISKQGVPLVSLVLSFAVGLLLLLPFPGWQRLVGFITSATALMYAFAPLSLASLRRQDPDRTRPFQLRWS
jgi:amino acid transporter